MTSVPERVAPWALIVVAACTRPAPAPKGEPAAGGASVDVAAIARAEDARRANDIPPEVRTSHDVAARRRSARALARIADHDSIEGLVAHLADEDPEAVAWAAYGLGYTCKGREDAHVRLLAARAVSLPPSTGRPAGARGAAELDPHAAIARAIGRCASPLSEQVLASFLTSASTNGGALAEPALLGLGDLAARKKQLGAGAVTALLDAAEDKAAPRDLALYALSRAEPSEALSGRIAQAARAALARPGEARVLAIRALGRAGKASPEATAELARVVLDARSFDAGERAEAARALGGLGAAGRAAIAAAIDELTPDVKDPIGIGALSGLHFHALYTLLDQLRAGAPREAEAALSVLATLTPPKAPGPGAARRLAELRCAAALALVRGAWDAEVLARCDAKTSEISQRARLAALLARPLTRDRLSAFSTFAKSEHLRVREDAVVALGSHPEVGEAAISVLAEALASKRAGLVATAAEVLNAHPERAMVLAAREKRAALDPRSPPPTTRPARELAPAVATALSAGLAEPWPEDRFETRIALVEAAASVGHPRAEEAARALCDDANPVLRERARKVLRALGASVGACEAPAREVRTTESGDALQRPVKIVLATDAGELSITLEPELSPIAATRIVALARSGFYKGVVIHRVIPGFVVQLGDPEGDGYGGAGVPLRCETSPVAFHRLDVGMALSGRDTGSSQLFVTLSRTPHLDGEYTRVGRAEGDWASVAQGDVVTNVRVVE